MRAIIVEDEPLARRRLRELLADFPTVHCVGEATDAPEAVRSIDALRPDLVFLDIEMPHGSGFDVLGRIRHTPAVVVTTAFDRYAVTAFELQAVDYLLKPFGKERLSRALERITDGSHAAARARDALASRGTASVERIVVRDRGRVVPIAVGDIVRLEADDDYTAVHVPGRRYLVYLPLRDFALRLDPSRFARIHRSHVVNLDRVADLSALGGGRFELRMSDGVRLPVSRAYARDFRARHF